VDGVFALQTTSVENVVFWSGVRNHGPLENAFAYVQNYGLDYVIMYLQPLILGSVQNKTWNSETTQQSEFRLQQHSSGFHSVILHCILKQILMPDKARSSTQAHTAPI
jgi:hypothetical protein